MENSILLKHIAELEAKLCTAENFINAITELNGLKVPNNNELQDELKKQRTKAFQKYKL